MSSSKIKVYVVLEEANEVNQKERDIWGVVRQDDKNWLMYGDLEQAEDWLAANAGEYEEVRA
jgi:beta-lactamase superfamily II metal-dependent hydrolase